MPSPPLLNFDGQIAGAILPKLHAVLAVLDKRSFGGSGGVGNELLTEVPFGHGGGGHNSVGSVSDAHKNFSLIFSLFSVRIKVAGVRLPAHHFLGWRSGVLCGAAASFLLS